MVFPASRFPCFHHGQRWLQVPRYGVRRREVAQRPHREEERGRPGGISCCHHRRGGAACSPWTSGTWGVLNDSPQKIESCCWSAKCPVFAPAVPSQWEEAAARRHEVVQRCRQGWLWDHQDLRRRRVSAAGREHERWRFRSPGGVFGYLKESLEILAL